MNEWEQWAERELACDNETAGLTSVDKHPAGPSSGEVHTWDQWLEKELTRINEMAQGASPSKTQIRRNENEAQ